MADDRSDVTPIRSDEERGQSERLLQDADRALGAIEHELARLRAAAMAYKERKEGGKRDRRS